MTTDHQEAWLAKAQELSRKIKEDWWPDDSTVEVYVGAPSSRYQDRRIHAVSTVPLACGERVELVYSFAELDTPSHSVYTAVLAMTKAYSLGVNNGRQGAEKKIKDTFNSFVRGVIGT